MKTKQQILESSVISCKEAGLSVEESIELAAYSLVSAVSASGNSHAKIEIENLGIVEVDC